MKMTHSNLRLAISGALCIFIVFASLSGRTQVQIDFNPQGLRDPFLAPAGFEVVDQEDESALKKFPFDIEINGVAIDNDKKYVIINKMIIKEKESWRGLTIDHIAEDHLVILYRGKKSKIPLKKEKL
jgi:hypothetical protein